MRLDAHKKKEKKDQFLWMTPSLEEWKKTTHFSVWLIFWLHPLAFCEIWINSYICCLTSSYLRREQQVPKSDITCYDFQGHNI